MGTEILNPKPRTAPIAWTAIILHQNTSLEVNDKGLTAK